MSTLSRGADTRRASFDARRGLDVQNITVVYKNGHVGLRDASARIPSGVIASLLGVNGSGKSTLFKAIMGVVPVAAGEVRVFGLPIKIALKDNLIVYVPQAEEIDWNFPVLVEDVVMMGRYGFMGMTRRPKAADHRAVAEALERVSMVDYRKRQIGELSGGQKKRMLLARALAQDGKAILLDEPFTGIDSNTEEQIVTLLRELSNEDRVMLVSTHNLGTASRLCDYTVLVNKTVLACGLANDVFTQENLARAFGTESPRLPGAHPEHSERSASDTPIRAHVVA